MFKLTRYSQSRCCKKVWEWSKTEQWTEPTYRRPVITSNARTMNRTLWIHFINLYSTTKYMSNNKPFSLQERSHLLTFQSPVN